MTIKSYEEINAVEIDVIKEIGSIGNGNAATALSSLLDTKVEMSLPEVAIMEFNAAMNHMGDPEEVVAGVLVEMSGEVQGIMLFILTQDFADEILKRMLKKENVDFMALNEIDASVLTEVGNIMISSFINAMSRLTNVNIALSVPQMAVNMLGGILSLPISVMGAHSDRIMMINAGFKVDKKELHSNMLLLPDVESLNVLMKKLGVD